MSEKVVASIKVQQYCTNCNRKHDGVMRNLQVIKPASSSSPEVVTHLTRWTCDSCDEVFIITSKS